MCFVGGARQFNRAPEQLRRQQLGTRTLVISATLGRQAGTAWRVHSQFTLASNLRGNQLRTLVISPMLEREAGTQCQVHPQFTLASTLRGTQLV